MRAGARVTSEPGEFGDSEMLPRQARERFNHARRQRAGQDARRLPSLGPDVQALCEMSAPAGTVTSRREAHPERPLAGPLPAALAEREWWMLTVSSTARCCGPAAPARRLALAATNATAGVREAGSFAGANALSGLGNPLLCRSRR